jgi:hypothetical protein
VWTLQLYTRKRQLEKFESFKRAFVSVKIAWEDAEKEGFVIYGHIPTLQHLFTRPFELKL